MLVLKREKREGRELDSRYERKSPVRERVVGFTEEDEEDDEDIEQRVPQRALFGSLPL